MNDTPPPQPVNPYEPSTLTTTDVTITNSDGFNAGGFAVPPGAIEALRQTRPWVLLISILGLICSAFLLLASLWVFLSGPGLVSAIQKQQGRVEGSTGLLDAAYVGVGIGYLLMAILCIYLVIKLFKYANAIKSLTASSSLVDLERALVQQKNFWKLFGAIALFILFVFLAILSSKILSSSP